MKLRPHQELAVEMLKDSLRAGNKRVVLGAPCSFGKTLTAAYILHNVIKKGKQAVIICDRLKLIEQTLEAYDGMGLEFGVIQGEHWRTDYSKPLQIASAQTLARRMEKFGDRAFPWDLAIIDECHTHYKYLTKIMERMNNIPMIGLSATPYSKGLGMYYQDLVVPTTPRELLANGYLCPVDYYGGRKIALEGVKTRRLSTGASDYDPGSLSKAVEGDTTLVGDVIANWKKHADGRQTVSFTPSINHSKELVRQFRDAGIGAEHVDGYMDPEEREDIIKAHDRGEFLILSCSRLLNTGWDSPSTSALIDCFPTKSLIVYIQRIGRIMRTAEGKNDAIVLDHAGNVARFGFAEDIVPESLDDGEKDYNERKQTQDSDKDEPTVRECPQCYRQFIGLRCSCGYEIPIKVEIKTTEEELQKLAKAENKFVSIDEKRSFYSQLMGYSRMKGYQTHWADHKYRERFGVWPNAINKGSLRLEDPTYDTLQWIKSRNIAWAKRKNK